MPGELGAPTCHLCERAVPATTLHHLIPRSVGRRRGKKSHELPTADLCPDCHRQLHALFPNRELAERLSSVAALKEEPRVGTFLAWLRKQSGTTRIRVRR